jgi:hypothetical protein
MYSEPEYSSIGQPKDINRRTNWRTPVQRKYLIRSDTFENEGLGQFVEIIQVFK